MTTQNRTGKSARKRLPTLILSDSGTESEDSDSDFEDIPPSVAKEHDAPVIFVSERRSMPGHSSLTDPSKRLSMRSPFLFREEDRVVTNFSGKMKLPRVFSEPEREADLVVSKSRLKSLREFFGKDSHAPGGRVLVLRGPSGSGKSASLRVMARECGVLLKPFRDSETVDFQTCKEYGLRHATVATKIDTFFVDALSPDLLLENSKPSRDGSVPCLVLEDVPFVNSSRPTDCEHDQRIVESIVRGLSRACASRSGVRVVLVDTVYAGCDSLPVRQLVVPGSDVAMSSTSVEFLPIAKSFARKALRQYAAHHQIEVTVADLDKVCLVSAGDLRQSFLILESGARSRTRKKGLSLRGKRARSSGQRRFEFQCAVGGRDAGIGLFHALGRVLHAKRIALGEGGAALAFDPQEVVEESGVPGGVLVSYVQENLPRYVQAHAVDALAAACDWISLSDRVATQKAERGRGYAVAQPSDNLAAYLCCFGVAVVNGEPLSGGFSSTMGPRMYKVRERMRRQQQAMEESREKIAYSGTLISSTTMASEYAPAMQLMGAGGSVLLSLAATDQTGGSGVDTVREDQIEGIVLDRSAVTADDPIVDE